MQPDPTSRPARIAGGVLLRRALARRCPLCGRGAIFRTHFRMNRACPSCQVVFWKDAGESLGAMYLDYAVAAGSFLLSWLALDLTTSLSDAVMFFALSLIAVGSVLVFYPLTRSLWTLLVYLSGGIERPPMRVIRGGKQSTDNRRRSA